MVLDLRNEKDSNPNYPNRPVPSWSQRNSDQPTRDYGQRVQQAGTILKNSGTAVKVGGTGLKYTGKGAAVGGGAMMRAGMALSETGVGAIAGIPLAVAGGAVYGAGKLTQGAGKAAEVGGSTAQKTGRATQSAGGMSRAGGIVKASRSPLSILPSIPFLKSKGGATITTRKNFISYVIGMVFVLPIAIFVDVVQAILTFLAIGTIISPIITVGMVVFVSFWLILGGNFSPRIWITVLLSTFGELIPIVDVLPLWSVIVWKLARQMR